MDINELNSRYEETFIEPVQEEIIVPTDREIVKEVVENEVRLRKMELAAWAEKKGIFQGAPKVEQLTKVWRKLRKGKSLLKSIKGVCSYTTWNKWRQQYPEIAAMEEECREFRVEKLQEQMMQIADKPDRTRMGETARDKLMIEVRQKELERLDRLTEIRMEAQKKPSAQNVVPIQINVAYGKEKPKDEVIDVRATTVGN